MGGWNVTFGKLIVILKILFIMRTIALIISLFAGLSLYAQKKSVPDSIKNAFAERYPSTDHVKYKAKKEHYQVRFIKEGHSSTAIYSDRGSWMRTETLLKRKELPERVKQALEKKYPNGSFSSGVFIEYGDGKINYRVSVDSPNAVFTVELDGSGKILSTDKFEKPKMQDAPESPRTGESEINDFK
jgi:hypothetical protein